MINYEKYYEDIKNMPEPIQPSQLPQMKIDFKGMVAYAKEQGVTLGDLPEEERDSILKQFTSQVANAV